MRLDLSWLILSYPFGLIAVSFGTGELFSNESVIVVAGRHALHGGCHALCRFVSGLSI